MAGLCSKHWGFADPTCNLCQAHPRDIFPDWDVKTAEAKAAGEAMCKDCGFKFYLTISSCPLCGSKNYEPINQD